MDPAVTLGILLVAVGALLAALPIFLCFGIVPSWRLRGGRLVGVQIGGEQAPDMPPTPEWLRNCALVALFAVGAGVIAGGMLIVVSAFRTQLALADWAENQSRETLEKIEEGLPSATPAPTATATASPTPAPPQEAIETLEDAVYADRSGDDSRAIDLYRDALRAELPQYLAGAAQLEIGLLELADIAELDPESDAFELERQCAIARTDLEKVVEGDADEATKNTGQNALDELSEVCR